MLKSGEVHSGQYFEPYNRAMRGNVRYACFGCVSNSIAAHPPGIQIVRSGLES